MAGVELEGTSQETRRGALRLNASSFGTLAMEIEFFDFDRMSWSLRREVRDKADV